MLMQSRSAANSIEPYDNTRADAEPKYIDHRFLEPPRQLSNGPRLSRPLRLRMNTPNLGDCFLQSSIGKRRHGLGKVDLELFHPMIGVSLRPEEGVLHRWLVRRHSVFP